MPLFLSIQVGAEMSLLLIAVRIFIYSLRIVTYIKQNFFITFTGIAK